MGGAAAAAVFAVLGTLSLPALLLAHLAPLPIMIVALGFGITNGATSAIVATAIISLAPQHLPNGLEQWRFGMFYGLLTALPSWLACYAASGAPFGGRDRLTRHLPAWACLVPAIVLAAVIGGLVAVATFTQGSLGEALSYLRGAVYLWLEHFREAMDLGADFDPKALSGSVTRVLPGALASYWLMIIMANLWIAAQLCRLSKLLIGPWPDIAQEYVLPRVVALLFAAAMGLSFLPGLTGVLAHIAAATLGTALLLQGLAVAHVFLRGSKSGVIVLSIIYFVGGLIGWPMILVLGVTDALFNYRNRMPAAPQSGAPVQKQ
jgi:hypothetical protein